MRSLFLPSLLCSFYQSYPQVCEEFHLFIECLLFLSFLSSTILLFSKTFASTGAFFCFITTCPS
ncbi:hypothetical protein CROQUDRAFT_420490 [Cronartium quercuum f. sp. fusiforme G11]|uniref:Uncharacterized protein n=1 Tax=Cronartium quercuum f. sp. fusiforme G11 TaxID=708437 RepID=A0A9P6NQ73_9BASI|nr:hypothetical protein CROQUDRAFT_420490 [Cronartium quercuum f. sp. fusiforme G11]